MDILKKFEVPIQNRNKEKENQKLGFYFFSESLSHIELHRSVKMSCQCIRRFQESGITKDNFTVVCQRVFRLL